MWHWYLLAVWSLVVVHYLLRLFFSRNDKVWVNQGVHFVKRGEVSSLVDLLTHKESLLEFDQKIYAKAGNVPYFGYVEAGSLVFCVKDAELVKCILTKDYYYFPERQFLNLGKKDLLFSRMLVNTTGKEWKDLRSVMTPTFSTAKMRRMFGLFNECGQELSKFLKRKRIESDVYDFQEAFGRFTIWAIAAIAFGQQTDAFEDDSTFREMAKKLSAMTALRKAKFVLYSISPTLAKALGISLSQHEANNFFKLIAQRNIQQRRSEQDHDSNMDRNDFLQLLLEAQAGKLKKTEKSELETFEKDAMLKDDSSVSQKAEEILDDTTLLAQCVLFFGAGSDTLESALTFAAYELALHADVQEKVAAEIHEKLRGNGGDLTYELLNEMEYLDMVISECMRLHPPVFVTARMCSKNYQLPNQNAVIPKDTRVMIPIRQIQRDPRYYQDPAHFNPENFSPEKKSQRHPYAYLPFGQGPKNCIAMRFAMIEAKAAMALLLHNFRLEPCDQTSIPCEYSKEATILKPKNGMFLRFHIRQWEN